MECRVFVSDDDIAFWEEHGNPAVTIDSARDVLRIFVNSQLQGKLALHCGSTEILKENLMNYNKMPSHLGGIKDLLLVKGYSVSLVLLNNQWENKIKWKCTWVGHKSTGFLMLHLNEVN